MQSKPRLDTTGLDRETMEVLQYRFIRLVGVWLGYICLEISEDVLSTRMNILSLVLPTGQ
ncbi:hypothetical protein J6590_029913 [Homalodisca vitripennis]|nr:hypothetical protein J6590_029913 [Homalodisca vitripennis]